MVQSLTLMVIFTLTVPQGATLVVSFIGYKTQEVAAAPSVIITLQDDAELLGEVVVIGYGTAKKNDLTGSVTAISADKMVKGAVTSATDMLVGKAAGVSVITDGGAPGAGATIRVRGGSSMSASNNPLIVIDGVPVDDGGINGMSNPLATVHPNDIETFTILKDASAAIYGAQSGAGGVVLVTTKKAKEGAPTLTYDGTFGFRQATNLIEPLNAEEQVEMRRRSYENAGQALPDGWNVTKNPWVGTTRTDWMDAIFRTAFYQRHNIALNVGTDKSSSRLSLSF